MHLRQTTMLFSTVAALALASTVATPAYGQAQANPAAEGQDRAQAPNASAIEEIVVTARKRSEDVREIPLSVSAFTAETLDQMGAQTLEDFVGTAPGVVFAKSVPQQSNITMRGIGTATAALDQNQGTTAILLDGVPLTDAGFAISLPDIDIFDLQRVEVLRGPQGAIFGTSALGGAINYIPTPVSLSDFEARAEARGSTVAHSNDIGYAAKAAINIPLIDNTLGIRLTGIHRYEPGYLDNIGIGERDTNSYKQDSFRIAALWRITDGFSFDFLSFYDRSRVGDTPSAHLLPNRGFYARDTFVPESGEFVTKINRLKFNADLKFAELTLTAADSRKEQDSQADSTANFGIPVKFVTSPRTHGRLYEARLVSPSGRRFEWLLGIYHGNLKEPYPLSFLLNGASLLDFNIDYRSNETSLFGQATYNLTDQLKVSAGGRYYNIRLRTVSESFSGGTKLSSVTGGDVNKGFSPNGSITYQPNDRVLVYGLVSTGFRQGAVNLIPPGTGPNATPATYQPDNLINYEVGLRTNWLDRRLTIDITPFYVDWNNIQTRLLRPDGFSYGANAAAATIKGVENSIRWRPNQSLSLMANLSYLDAKLSRRTELGGGSALPKGSPLPGSSHWTSYEAVTYRWDTKHEPYLTVSHQYVSKALGGFLGDPPNPLRAPPVGNYNLFDVRAGLGFGNLGATFFISNIGDTRGVTAAAFAGTTLRNFYVRPRTFGVVLDWRM